MLCHTFSWKHERQKIDYVHVLPAALKEQQGDDRWQGERGSMANTTEAYCEGRGRVTIDMIRQWIQGGQMTKRQVQDQLRFRCLGEHCTAVLIPELGTQREWNFREHYQHKHSETCPYRIAYKERAGFRLKKERAFDVHRLVGKHTVDLTSIFRPPRGMSPKGSPTASAGPAGGQRTIGKYQVRRRIVGTRSQPRDLDEFALFLLNLQLKKLSWTGRFLHGLPGAQSAVPLRAAVFTSETPVEVLEQAIGHERFVFGRVVKATTWKSKDPRFQDETHLVLERLASSDVELNVLLPHEFHDTIKEGHTVLVRGTIKWRVSRTSKFYLARVLPELVALCRYPANDGHRLRSNEEVQIDNFLARLRQKYRIEHDVPGLLSEEWPIWRCRKVFGRFVPDWLLKIPGRGRQPVVVEYYGFAQEGDWGPARLYREKRKEKESFYASLPGFRYLGLDRPPDGNFAAMLERELAPYIAEAQEPEPEPEIPAVVAASAVAPRIEADAPTASVAHQQTAVSSPPVSPVLSSPTRVTKVSALLRRLIGWKL